MNAKSLSKNYHSLTPEERFRLILAASGRGDDLERDRLGRAGKRITLSMEDHAPYAHAFDELALMTFLDLLDHAARFFDAIACLKATYNLNGIAGLARTKTGQDAPDDAAQSPSTPRAKTEVEGCQRPAGGAPACIPADLERDIHRALAIGFVLRTLTDGWKLFCEELNVPPLVIWQCLPGFYRLQTALALNENAPFGPEQYLQWCNSIRPTDTPEITEFALTADAIAAGTKNIYRDRVRWWGGLERP
jgi:hypothetical protein